MEIKKEILTALLIIGLTVGFGMLFTYGAGLMTGQNIALDACAGCMNMAAGLGG